MGFDNFAPVQAHRRSLFPLISNISMRSRLPIPVLLVLVSIIVGCSRQDSTPAGKKIPVVGFMQIVEDPTLNEAKDGFYDALREAGYREDSGTVKIIYQNASGDAATLNQIADHLVSEQVDLIAANTTLAMITAANKTHTIPIFMMVAPSPELAGLSKPNAPPPANLFGVYETLAYIDTSVGLIHQVFPAARRVGTIYNSSEPNSTNALARLRAGCAALGLELVELPVTASNETQQAAQTLAGKGVDVFFALPDNVMFASFETVAREMSRAKIPVVTSESGLVARGALLGYGADFRAWGHQAGVAAARYLKTHNPKDATLEIVAVRKRTYNPATARELGITPPTGFEPIH